MVGRGGIDELQLSSKQVSRAQMWLQACWHMLTSNQLAMSAAFVGQGWGKRGSGEPTDCLRGLCRAPKMAMEPISQKYRLRKAWRFKLGKNLTTK